MHSTRRPGIDFLFISLTILFLMAFVPRTVGFISTEVTTSVFNVDSCLFLLCPLVLFCSYCFITSDLRMSLLNLMQRNCYRARNILQRALRQLTRSMEVSKMPYWMWLRMFVRISSAMAPVLSLIASWHFYLYNEWISFYENFLDVILVVFNMAIFCGIPRVVYGLFREMSEFPRINGSGGDGQDCGTDEQMIDGVVALLGGKYMLNEDQSRLDDQSYFKMEKGYQKFESNQHMNISPVDKCLLGILSVGSDTVENAGCAEVNASQMLRDSENNYFKTILPEMSNSRRHVSDVISKIELEQKKTGVHEKCFNGQTSQKRNVDKNQISNLIQFFERSYEN